MIQRLQSVYLLLVIIMSVIFISGKLLTYNNSQGQIRTITFTGETPGAHPVSNSEIIKILPVSILSLLIPILALISAMLYKNRKVQAKFVMILLGIEILLIGTCVGYYIFLFRNQFGGISFGYRAVIPLINIILTLLALQGIRKDEKLVKSYDRLR